MDMTEERVNELEVIDGNYPREEPEEIVFLFFVFLKNKA